MNIYKLFTLFLLVTIPSTGIAGDIYRWVDDQGMVHYGDIVPDKYKDTATRKPELRDEHPVIDVRGNETEQDARTRAREILENKPLQPSRTAPTAEPAEATAAPQDPSCTQLWAEYNASQACFSTYRNANGSIRAEAFEHCKVVTEPARCE